VNKGPSSLKSPIKVSILVKALNEEANIERCVRSCLKALENVNGEVIVADSHSDDATTEIASRFPVKVVQLTHKNERGCGVAAQLGFQYARGEYLYIIDGDMELPSDFFHEAIKVLDSSPDVAGVGGLLEEIQPETHLSRIRASRKIPKHQMPGEVDRLDGGGLFRRSAVEQSGGYLTHPGLHAFEELELALRLCDAGWKLLRLDMVSMRHAAHTDPPFSLLARRWRSRYANGSGELLMAALGQPYFSFVLKQFKFNFVIWFWWLMVIVCLITSVSVPLAGVLSLFLLLFPFAAMIVRKRSISLGVYAVSSWNIFSAGMLRGILAGKPRNPVESVSSQVIHDGVQSANNNSTLESGLAGAGS